MPNHQIKDNDQSKHISFNMEVSPEEYELIMFIRKEKPDLVAADLFRAFEIGFLADPETHQAQWYIDSFRTVLLLAKTLWPIPERF